MKKLPKLRSETDLNQAIAKAVTDLDGETLEYIRRVTEYWLEPEGEKDARRNMLDSIIGLVYDAVEN